MNTETVDDYDNVMIYNQESGNHFELFHQVSAAEQYFSINNSQEQFNQFRTQQMKSKTKNTPKTFGCKFNKFLTFYQKSNKASKGCPIINKFIKKKKSDIQVSYGLKDFNTLLQGQRPELAEQYLTQGLYLDLLQSNRILSPQDMINSIEYYALQFKRGKVEVNRPHVKNYDTKAKQTKDPS